nr:hypothetical protein [Novosphingobium sp. HII-3]
MSPPSYSIALAVIGVESQLLLHFKARCDRILFGVESAEIDLTAPVSDLRIPTSPAAIKTYAHHAASVCRSYSYIPAIFFFRAITKIADAVVIAVAVYVIDHADRISPNLPSNHWSNKIFTRFLGPSRGAPPARTRVIAMLRAALGSSEKDA